MAGEEGGDMRFLLPGGPSPAALAALLSACRELDRAGAACMLALVQVCHGCSHVCQAVVAAPRGRSIGSKAARSVGAIFGIITLCKGPKAWFSGRSSGGHWLGTPALALLEWELSGAAVAALGSLQGE